MYHSIFRPNNTLEFHSAGWLSFENPDDEESSWEAEIYLDAHKDFWVGTSHVMVGLITYHGPFESLEKAENWLESEDFDYFGG